MMDIRHYKGQDIEEIIHIWNMQMPFNQITKELFIKNLLLDLNFDPQGFFVACDGEEIIGFVYAVKRRIPVDVGGSMDLNKGWICAIGIKKNILLVGKALLEAAETYLKEDGNRTIYACSYTPNYFYQGINIKYEDYIKLFEQLGYHVCETSVSMKIDLKTYKSPEGISELHKKLTDEGIIFQDLSVEHIPSWLTFQKPSWTHRFRRLLNETGCFDHVNIAVYNGEVIGCNIFGDPYSTEERFGPFGVRDDFQGRRIGTILLDQCLVKMREKGLSYAWMQWATAAEYVVNMYLKFGFEIMDTYKTFVKE